MKEKPEKCRGAQGLPGFEVKESVPVRARDRVQPVWVPARVRDRVQPVQDQQQEEVREALVWRLDWGLVLQRRVPEQVRDHRVPKQVRDHRVLLG